MKHIYCICNLEFWCASQYMIWCIKYTFKSNADKTFNQEMLWWDPILTVIVRNYESLFSIRHPVLYIPLRPRRHGCDGHSVPERHLPLHPADLPPSAGQGAVHSHQGAGETATQTGLQCIPLFLWSEYRSERTIFLFEICKSLYLYTIVIHNYSNKWCCNVLYCCTLYYNHSIWYHYSILYYGTL